MKPNEFSEINNFQHRAMVFMDTKEILTKTTTKGQRQNALGDTRYEFNE